MHRTGRQASAFSVGDSTVAAIFPGLRDAGEKFKSFRLARFTSPGCAPILDVGINTRCDEMNRVALGFLASARPEMVLLHAMWSMNNDIEKLHETIEQLRSRKEHRIILLGPMPVWKRTLPHAVINQYRLRHEIPQRISVGVSGPEEDARMESFAKAERIEYISARKILCTPDGCLTMAGPSGGDVIATDIVRLSQSGSKFIVSAIGKDLVSEP
jgi:SGNH domain (fused to AT3 domains)